MPLFGRIVVIKRDGTDGAQFLLTSPVCTFGRDSTCDIRVQLPSVAKEHCRIEVDDASGRIFLVNLCEIWPTQLNKAPVVKKIEVKHQDVFTVTERSFRLEFPPSSPLRDNSLEDASSVNDKKPAFKMTPSLTASCKRKTLSPIAARHSAIKASVVTPGRAVKSTAHTPVAAAKHSSGRTSGVGVATSAAKATMPAAKVTTSAAKAKVAGASLSRKSDILSAEIAELKSALLKAQERTATTKPTAIVKPTTTPITKANSFVVTPARMVSSTPMFKTPSTLTKAKISPPDTLSKLSSRDLTTPSTKLLAGNVSMVKTPRTNSKASVQPLSSRIHQVRKTMSPKMSAKVVRRSSGITPGANKGRKSSVAKQIAEGKLADSECKTLDFAFEGSFIKDTTADQNLKGLEMSGIKSAAKSSCQVSYPENAPSDKLKALFDDSFGSAAKRYSSPALPVRRSSSLTTPSRPRTSEPRSAGRPRSSTSATSPASTRKSPSPRASNLASGSKVKSPRVSSGRRSRSPTKTPTVNSGRRRSSAAKILDSHSNTPVISPIADSFGSTEPSFGLDDTDEGSKSARKKSDRINSSMPRDSDPGSLRTKVNHLRRKSMPLVEESELPLVRAGASEAEMDFVFTKENHIQDTNSSGKQSHKSGKGVKRSGSPLKGRPPKRCVSFGPEISPELFDQNLPTKTPLKRGATPRRVSISVDRVEQCHKPLLKKRFSSIAAIEEARSSESKSPNRKPKLMKTKSDASPVNVRASNSPTQTPAMKTETSAMKTPTENVLASLPAVASTSGSQQKRKIFTSGTKTTRTASGRRSAKLSLTSDDTLTPMSTSNQSSSSIRNLKEVQNVDPFVYELSPDSSPSRSSRKTPLSVSATYRASLGEHESISRRSLEPASSSLIKSRRKSTSKSEENISSPLFNDDVKSPVRKRSPVKVTPKGSRNLSLSPANRKLTELSSARRRAKSSEKKSAKMSAELLPAFSGLGQIQIQLLNNEEFSKGTPSRAESVGRRSKSLLRRSFANSFDDSSQNEEDLMKSAKSNCKSNRKSSLLAESLNSSKVNAADEDVHDGVSLDKFSKEIEDLFAAVKIKPSRVVTPKVVSSKASPKSPKGRKSVRRSSLQKVSSESPENKKDIKSLGAENAETLIGSETLETFVLKPTTGRKSYLANKSSVIKVNIGSAKVSASASKLPFRQSFGSEPKKLHASKNGRLSLEVAKTAALTRKPTKMVSERNIDLANLANISPLKFYKSPANEIVKHRRSKVTPGRAVALRAVFGKAALPSLSQLQKSKTSPSSRIKVTELNASVEKLNSGEADAVRKRTVERKSKVPRPVKLVTKKTGFAVKNKPTKLVLKPKPGEKPFGKIAGKILAVRKVKQRQLIRKPDAVQKTVVAAETELIEVLYNKEDSESSVSHLTVETPPGPGEMFVSPWSTPTPDKNSGKKRSGRKRAGSNISGSKRQNASRTDASSPLLSGLKSLVKTPKVQASPRLSGVKAMMKTPAVQKSPELEGLKDLMKTMTIPDSPRFDGLREMMKTPAVQNSPRMIGLKALVKTPKVQQSPKLSGLKKLLKTPKAQASPKLGGLRKMLKTPKLQKSPRLAGIKTTMKSPKVQKSPQLNGVRKLVKTPKVQKSPRLSGVKQLVKSPKQQKSPKLSGLKTLTKTPKVQNSPDLRNLKSLFVTVKEMKTPRLDGLKVLLNVPKSQVSPDYTGLMEMMASPPSQVANTPKISGGRRTPRGGGAKVTAKTPATKPSPRLSGIRKLVKTPKVAVSPDLYGIQQLLLTPDVEQSTTKKARGKAAGITPLTKENLHQSPLLKTGSAKGKGRTTSVKVSQELMPTAASEPSPVSPQVVKKRRVSKNARGTSGAKEVLELSLNTQDGDVGIDSKVVRNKRKRSDSAAMAVSKKRRLNESGISDTEAGIVTETAKDFEPIVRKTRRNEKLDAMPNAAMQNVEVDVLSAKTPSKGRGRNKPAAVAEGSRASSKVLPIADVSPAVELPPRNLRGKKQPVEKEEPVIVPQGQAKNSRTKRGSKKNSENEIPSVVSAAELPKRRQRKPITDAAENGNEVVSSNIVTGKGNKKTSLKVSTSAEVLVVEAVRSTRRGRQGKTISAEALLQNRNDDGENGVVVEHQSKTVEKLSGTGRSKRELAVKVVAVQNQTSPSSRRGTRAKSSVADSLNKQVADQDAVDPTACKRGTGKRKVVVKEPRVVVQESDRAAGRKRPAVRGRRVIIDVAAYLANNIYDAAEHDSCPQSQEKSRQSKNEESRSGRGKADVTAAAKSSLKKGSRKRKGETEPVEAEIKTKRMRVTKAEEVLEAGSASRKGRNSVKINSVAIDRQNDVQESNSALRNRSSRRGLSKESELKSTVSSKKPKGGRNAKPAAATAGKISPKNTRGKVVKTVPSIVTDTSAFDAKSKSRSRKVAFDVPPTPVIEASTKKKAKESAKGKAASKKIAAKKISQESVSAPSKGKASATVATAPSKGKASATVARKNLRSAKK